ncbi:MAG TPA: G1 family glutamic endopeptidase [Gaiellaceae bacterium]|nr:G1 family glutamic endopeptidase [Gaiellaceae bacterium]
MRFVRLAVDLLLLGLIAGSTALGSSGTSGALEHVPPASLIGHSTSLNWSGYASIKSTFDDVKGSWIQPAAKCNGKSTYSSFWVGLDGYSSSTVEQLGTEADCSKGKPVYYAWWEIFPDPSRMISRFVVTPGATYTAQVQLVAGDLELTLSGGGNQPFSLSTGQGAASLSSAEWIAEAPSMCSKTCRELPLTNFGTVNFNGASTNGSAIDDSAWSFDPLTMVTGNGTAKAVPSSLSQNGSAFSVTWHHD